MHELFPHEQLFSVNNEIDLDSSLPKKKKHRNKAEKVKQLPEKIDRDEECPPKESNEGKEQNICKNSECSNIEQADVQKRDESLSNGALDQKYGKELRELFVERETSTVSDEEQKAIQNFVAGLHVPVTFLYLVERFFQFIVSYVGENNDSKKSMLLKQEDQLALISLFKASESFLPCLREDSQVFSFLFFF